MQEVVIEQLLLLFMCWVIYKNKTSESVFLTLEQFDKVVEWLHILVRLFKILNTFFSKKKLYLYFVSSKLKIIHGRGGKEFVSG